MILCAVIASTACCLAEDLKTLDGKSFQNVKISGVDEGRVKILHDSGLTWIDKKNLPPEFITVHNIPAGDPVKLAKEQAAASARRNEVIALNEAKKKEETEAKAKLATAVRIRGTVVIVVPEGIITQMYRPRIVSSSSRSIGMGGGVSSSDDKMRMSRPNEIYGDFLLVKHPSQSSMADDTFVDVDAAPVGIFKYGNSTIKKYEVLKAFK